jgi:hypothetical protein
MLRSCIPTATRTRCSRTRLPAGFNPSALVTPQQVIFTATDGMPIHSQLFMPKDIKSAKSGPALIFFHGGSRRQMLLNWHYNYYYRNSYADEQWLASQGIHRAVGELSQRHRLRHGVPRSAQLRRDRAERKFNDVMGAGLYLKNRADVDSSRIGSGVDRTAVI